MSERTLKRIGVVLAVLVLAWIVVTVTRGGPPEPGEGGGEMAVFLESLTPEAATSVSFAGGGPDAEAVRLERGAGATATAGEEPAPGTGWTVEDHPVDSARMARFLTGLAEAGTGAPVSVNPANHVRMGVDDASARVLVLERPEGTDTLLVGESGPGSGTVYARLPGRDEVHVVGADLSSHAGRSADDWRSARMAAVDTATVAAVEIERDGSSYLLERGDSAWTVDGEPARATAVRNLLGELASLEAQGFPEEEEGADEGAAGLTAQAEPDRTVTARNADGEEVLVVRMWEPGEGAGTALEAVATGPAALQSDTRFTVPSWRVDRLAPERVGVQEGG